MWKKHEKAGAESLHTGLGASSRLDHFPWRIRCSIFASVRSIFVLVRVSAATNWGAGFLL
jgi:hypothetical protein